MALTEKQRMLRDVAGLLGLPAIALACLYFWGWPRLIPFLADQRPATDIAAINAGYRETRWMGLKLSVPEQYVLTLNTPLLEVIEVEPSSSGPARWPSRLAFLKLDRAAQRRFSSAADNCGLAPGRCWSDTVAAHVVHCQRSSGVPDPDLPWTPQLECQVPELGVRAAINAPSQQALILLRLFEDAVETMATDTGRT
jgi:hypothetical protein